MPDAPAPRVLHVAELGVMEYEAALRFQRAVAAARIAGALEHDVLLLVEHPHVITLGRASCNAAFVAAPALLEARGVQRFDVDRGGDVTYHGPGQLVGYPIFDLKEHRQDLHWYLRSVEEALILALGHHGLSGERNTGFTGVWISGRKVASIGVHARDWVTWHGFALNVATDLSFFDLIVPCGIEGVEMTSVSRELGSTSCSVGTVADNVVAGFEAVFARRAEPIPLAWLEERVTSYLAPVGV